jgi:hypothetical protein
LLLFAYLDDFLLPLISFDSETSDPTLGNFKRIILWVAKKLLRSREGQLMFS